MCNANIGLLRPAQIRLRNQYVAHTQHAQAAQFFWRIKYDRRESRWHFGIQTNLDTRLDFIFAFHQQVEQLLSVDDGFSEICHQADQCCIPFVNDFGECC